MKRLLKLAGALAALLVLAIGSLLGVAFARWDRAHDVDFPQVSVSQDPTVLARGEYLVHGPAACAMCHAPAPDVASAADRSSGPLPGGWVMELPGFGTFRPSNLTSDVETGLGRRTPEQIARTIRNGVHADGSLAPFMAIHANAMADDDLSAVVSYLLSTEAVRNDTGEDEPGWMAKMMMAFVFEPARPTTRATAPAVAPTVERGKYLAEEVALCAFCHTEHDPVTMAASAPLYSGGAPNPSPFQPDLIFAPPNLTAGEGGVLRRFDEDAFVARFHAGKLIAHSPMPWPSFATMTDDDVRAIYRYLKTVSPVDKDNGPAVRDVR